MSYQNKKLFRSLRENTIPGIKIYFRSASTSFLIPKLSRFINKNLNWLGLASSLNRYDNSLTLYSFFSDRKLYSDYSTTDKFIKFGSGAFYHKRWKNYDYPGQSSYYKSLQGNQGEDYNPIDLCNENLSVPELDDSVKLIYCSHTLEHLDKDSSLRFIRECHRILKKDGIFRIALPNTRNDFYLLRCLKRQRNILDSVLENYTQNASSHVLADTKDLDFDKVMGLMREASFESHAFYERSIKEYPEMALFNGKNPERHINYWDLNNLTDIMNEAGFNATIPTYQGSSVASPFCNLHVFDSTEPHITLYADVIK